MLEAADHEPAGLRIGDAGLLGTQIDGAGLVGGHADFGVEPGPALGADFALKRRSDLVFRLRPQLDGDELLGA